MPAIHVEDLEQWNKLVELNDNKKYVVKFSAQWCGPCKAVAPKYDELSNQYSDIPFYSLDIDQVPEVAELFNVSAMPTFIIIANNAKIKDVVGADMLGLRIAIENS